MRGLAAAGLVALLPFAPPSEAGAVEGDGFSLTVSPARTVVVADGGEAHERFTVENTGTEPLHLLARVTEFSQDADGTVAFAPGPGATESWVKVTPPSFDLRPGEARQVVVAVTVPDRPEPGDHQIGVAFVVPAAERGANVALARGIGTQLLVRVEGPVVRRIEVGDLDAPWLADGGPIILRLPVHNRGNVHRDFYGADRLVATRGDDRIEFSEFSVLREATRDVEASWEDPPLFCVCRVTVRVDDGQGNTVVASARVIVFPVRLVVGVGITAAGLWMLRRARKRAVERRFDAQLEEARRQAREDARRDLEDQRN